MKNPMPVLLKNKQTPWFLFTEGHRRSHPRGRPVGPARDFHQHHI